MTEEHRIQNEIRAAVSVFCIIFRMNVGKGYTMDGRWFSSDVPAGFSDLFGVRKSDGRAVFIEVKTPKGRPTKEQKHFLEQMRDAGAATPPRPRPCVTARGIRRRWRPCWPAVIVLPCRLRSPCVTTSPRWNVLPCRCCGVPEPEGSSFSCDFLDVVQARCGRSCPLPSSAAIGRHGHPFWGKRQGAGAHTARSRESRMRLCGPQPCPSRGGRLAVWPRNA